VALVREARPQRNFRERQCGVAEKELRALDALAENVLMRRKSHALRKGTGETIYVRLDQIRKVPK
jgi:hypothetical protein